MNGAPLLEKIAAALADCRLEAILIGNAGAALHGAPVTTVDFDFMFRKTEANLTKVRKVASCLGGTKAADRPRDRAVLEVLEKTLHEAQKDKARKK